MSGRSAGGLAASDCLEIHPKPTGGGGNAWLALAGGRGEYVGQRNSDAELGGYHLPAGIDSLNLCVAPVCRHGVSDGTLTVKVESPIKRHLGPRVDRRLID